ncbi:GMP synthase (glutamine-hydrolyzing) [Sarotherodon galilaeus]
MDSGDGVINGPNQRTSHFNFLMYYQFDNVGLRFRPLLHLVECYEQYNAVSPEMSLLWATWKLTEIFYDILWLGNIEVEARVDHVALAMLPAGIGINPAVGAGSWDNGTPPVPAVAIEKNLASLAKDPWDPQGVPLPAVNVDDNLPWEAEDQLADEMWWIWESNTDSGSKNESDTGGESDDNVLELIPINPEPQGSRSPPREEADESGPVINAPDFESSSPEPESSRRRQREENDNGDSHKMNKKRFRFFNSGNKLSDL